MVINVGMLDRNAALPPVPHFDHIDDPRINKLIAQRSPGPELISRLTPAQIDRLEQDIQSAIFDDMWLLDDSGHLIDQAEEIPKQVHAD